jgi:predicted negative regulator of RcsB-dependent stress response
LAEHHDELEQIEALKRWWLENRAFVIAGLVIGVATVAAWRGWEWHQTRQAEQASALYEEIGDAIEAKDRAKADAAMTALKDGYARTPYAANAALLMAKDLVEAGDLAAAQGLLEWAASTAADREIATLARIRLARLQVSAGEPQKALGSLAAIEAGAFEALVQDARGDAHAALGQAAEARKAWQAALDASDGNLADRQLIELKLAALGPADGATAPATAAAPATAPATGTDP